MRFIVLAISLSFTCLASADQVIFTELNNSKITGDVTIYDSGATYFFDKTPPFKSYALIIYEKGNCDSYSSPIVPMMNDKNGKAVLYDSEHTDLFMLVNGDLVSMSQRSGAYAGRSRIINIDLKGKVIVLEDVDSSNKSTGVGVACGIHP